MSTLQRFGLLLSVVCAGSFGVAGGAELAYRWEPGQTFSYQVEVVVDSDAETTTYKGIIHYKVDNVNQAQSTVKYSGGLSESKKFKSSRHHGFGPRFGPPSIPSPFSQPTIRGTLQTTNSMTITPRGKTLAMQGDSQLPYLLGNVFLMPFQPLAEGDVTEWLDDGDVSITEKGNGDPRSVRRLVPMSPFAQNNDPEDVQAASETSSYEMNSTDGDLVTVSKSYRLNAPATKDSPSCDMTGNGTWTFNKEKNVPHAYDMSFNLVVNDKNTTTSVPITVKYNRISREKLAEMEAEAKKRAETRAMIAAEVKRISETPLTSFEKEQTLAALGSSDDKTIRRMLDRLATKSLKNPDAEIADAIEPHLTSQNRQIARSARHAMTKWSPSYAARKSLEIAYGGPGPVPSTGRVVESTTPLAVGQVVQARKTNGGSHWYAARVKRLQHTGDVALAYLAWGEERDLTWERVARNNIQLAPPELPQPKKRR